MVGHPEKPKTCRIYVAAHRKLKSDWKNRPGEALQLRLRQYSEHPSGPLMIFFSSFHS